MLTSWSLKLRVLIRRLLRRPTTNSPSLFSLLLAEPGHSYDVSAFTDRYLLSCRVAAEHANHEPEDPDLLPQLFISRVQLFRRRSSPDHEYLRIFVAIRPLGDEPGDAWLQAPLGNIIAERSARPGDDKVKGDTTGVVSPPSPVESIAALDAFIFESPRNNERARDRLVFDHKFCRTADAPHFNTLIAAATALNTQSPDHIVPPRQCYWFSSLLYCILTRCADDDAMKTAHSISIGVAYETTTGQESVVDVGRAGTFWRLFKAVTSTEIDELYDAEIASLYQAKLRALEESVKDSRASAVRLAAMLAAIPAKDATIAAQNAAIAALDAAIAAKHAAIATNDPAAAAMATELDARAAELVAEAQAKRDELRALQRTWEKPANM